MSPVLRTGDMIYVEPVKTDELAAGDIILFKRAGNLVAHRLIEKIGTATVFSSKNGRCPYFFFTKGDTFPYPDDRIEGKDIIGRVYAVEKHGRMLDLRKGMCSVLNKLAHKLSPLTAVLYGVIRRYRDIIAVKGMDAGPNEHRFIISLLKNAFSGEPSISPDTSIDLPGTLKSARENGVSQKLYAVLRKGQASKTFDDFMDRLRKDYLFTAATNTLIYAEFKRVIEGFIKKHIDVMAMKGIVLAELVYQDIGIRSMSDVDLLIRKQDIQKADDLLDKLGYSAVDPSPFDGIDNDNNYLTTRDYRSKNPAHPSFHIHWHIVNSSIPAPYASKINMDRIWEDALPVNIAGVNVLSMSPHHFLLHLCEHAMRVTHSTSKLVYLIDIAALISKYEDTLDWRKVIDSGREWGLERFVYNVLVLCGLNIGVEAPEWVLSKLKPEKRTIGERLFLYLTARGKGFSGLSYPVHLTMNKGIAKKTVFIFRTAFPPSWVLAKRDLSGHKKPVLLYLHRLWEILGRLVPHFSNKPLSVIPACRESFLKNGSGQANNRLASSRCLGNRAAGMTKILIVSCVLAGGLLSTALSLSFASGPVIEKNSTYTTESGLPEYLIAVGDVLDVKVWRGFEEKKYEAIVKADGFITVGFVDVKAGDKTVRQVEADLRTALSEYIKEPKTEVSVKEYRGRTATLLGAVQATAKQYQLKGKTTLSQLVIMAGGFTKDADMENVQITKPDGRMTKANLFQVMFGGDVLNDIVIDNGDSVYVPLKPEAEEKNVFVFGQVNSPGVHKLSTNLTLLQVIGRAGGYKEEALLDEIKIIRGGLDRPQIIATNVKVMFDEGDITKDIPLQKNDIIFVPKSKIANWNTFLSKIRPTLDLLILPFAGTQVIRDVIKGKQQ